MGSHQQHMCLLLNVFRRYLLSISLHTLLYAVNSRLQNPVTESKSRSEDITWNPGNDVWYPL